MKRKIIFSQTFRFIKLTFMCIWLFVGLTPETASSQGEWNKWYFGQHAGLDFNSGVPIAINNCAPSFLSYHTTATASDSIGNLLFYVNNSNATTVYDKNNMPMPNTGGLPNFFDTPQPVFIVQKLDDDKSYYLFTQDTPPIFFGGHGLCYSVIDMRLNNGLGDIVNGQKNIPVPGAQNTASLLTGIRHHNNKDVWIVVRKYDSYNYYSYLITSGGINPQPVVSSSLLSCQTQTCANCINNLRISPDGTTLVGGYGMQAEYCKFDDETGLITPVFVFQSGSNPSQFTDAFTEFSVDSKYFYTTVTLNNPVRSELYQYDATKTDYAGFKQSETLIFTKTGIPRIKGLQRGPDNKIYCTVEGVDSLSIISNPTIQGAGCAFQNNAIYLLSNNLSYYGLPQFLQRYYAYIHDSGTPCTGNPVQFSSSAWPTPDSIHWDFGDPSSGVSNYSLLPDPVHTYTSSGTYTVTLFVRHNDKRTDTAWKTIDILSGPAPVVTVSNGIVLHSSIPTGNQWFYEGGSIQGATNQEYTADKSGIYWCTAMVNSCLSDTSNHVNITLTSLEFEAGPSGDLFKLYPDPNDGQFAVSIDNTGCRNFTIRIYNNLGVMIKEISKGVVGMTKKFLVDLGPVPSGLYLVVIENGEKRVVRKMVVSH